MLAGVVGLLAGAAAWMVARRAPGARLRRPTDQQAQAIAAPLGRILTRHADLGALTPTLADAIAAAGATGAYLNAGPLVEHDQADAGVPSNIQHDTEWMP